MNFKEYKINAIKTLRHQSNGTDLEIARLALGLSGESGEVAEKVKKYLRDTDMSMIARDYLAKELEKELGDVLWYITTLGYVLGLDLEKIAIKNVYKLSSRAKRNKITGSGDNR